MKTVNRTLFAEDDFKTSRAIAGAIATFWCLELAVLGFALTPSIGVPVTLMSLLIWASWLYWNKVTINDNERAMYISIAFSLCIIAYVSIS